MAKRQVFYSFHYANDVFRVQQVRNIGAIDDNKPVSPNDWEELKKNGNSAIKKWIDDNMQNRSCVVVLVGSETATRSWVRYEIEKAWKEKRGLVGIYIHNLKCPTNGKCQQGANPFDQFLVADTPLSNFVRCYNPNQFDAYNNIKNNLEVWIEEAIRIRDNIPYPYTNIQLTGITPLMVTAKTYHS